MHLTTPDSKLKSEWQIAYKEVQNVLANIFPNVDGLGGNHLVAIAGTLGFLPLCVSTEIEIEMIILSASLTSSFSLTWKTGVQGINGCVTAICLLNPGC